jgi:hypothetical protein
MKRRHGHDEEELPPIPTPETDPRLRIPEVLKKSGPGLPAVPGAGGVGGLAGMARAWGVAFDFVGTVLGGMLLGYFFDRWRGTTPAGTLTGLGVGFAAALVRILRRTMAEERAAEAAKRGRRE